MSRVRIGTLVDDFVDSPFEGRDKTKDIEVVPRKMVEMIIEKCKEIQDCNNDDEETYQWGAWSASEVIKECAESLLEQFEKEGE